MELWGDLINNKNELAWICSIRGTRKISNCDGSDLDQGPRTKKLRSGPGPARKCTGDNYM